MTGRERVFATLGGQPADRRPVAPLLSLYGARLTRCDVPRYYQDAEAFGRGQVAVERLFHPDILFGPFCASTEAAAFGCVETFFAQAPPVVSKPAIADASQADRLILPDPDRHPRLLFVREAVRRVVATCGQRAAIVAVAISPLDLPALLLGLDGWLQALLFEPDQAEAVLEITTRHFVSWSKTLLADGADLVAVPMIFSNPSVVGPTAAQSILLPSLRKAIAAVPGPILVHHGGCALAPHLGTFLDLPNVIGFAMGAGEDLRAARRSMGPERLLLCGVEGPSLNHGGVGEIAAGCRAVLDEAREDPRFILSTTSADVPYDTPPANVLTLMDSVRPLGNDGSRRKTIIACSVFEPELRALDADGTLQVETLYLDSMLHVEPTELDRQLTSILEARSPGRVGILFGDCHANMAQHADEGLVTLGRALNCCEWLLGRDRYRQLRRDGAFIVLPEWAPRWREALDKALGPDPELVREMMAEVHTHIVYLAPPGGEIPVASLDALSAHTGLPWVVEEVDRACLLQGVQRLLDAGGLR